MKTELCKDRRQKSLVHIRLQLQSDMRYKTAQYSTNMFSRPPSIVCWPRLSRSFSLIIITVAKELNVSMATTALWGRISALHARRNSAFKSEVKGEAGEANVGWQGGTMSASQPCDVTT